MEVIDFTDYGDDELIFSFEDKNAVVAWQQAEYGESTGGIVEFSNDDIYEILSNAMKTKTCSKSDKIFMDHLISILESDNEISNDKLEVIESNNENEEIEEIRIVCKEINENEIEYLNWLSYFVNKGFNATKRSVDIEIKMTQSTFIISNKNNSHIPKKVSFIEGKFAGWIK